MIKKKISKAKSRKGSKRYVRRRRTMFHNPRVEKKHFDKVNGVSVTNLGNLLLLTDVTAQGTDDNQRIGDTIYGMYIFLKIKFSLNSGSTYDNIRIIIFQDRMGVNAPAVTDILEGGTLGGGIAPLSQYNHYYLSRFKKLYDRLIKISTGYSQSTTISRYIPIYSKLSYIGASTFKNQVYMLLVSDETNILSLPSAVYTTRLMYTDQ